jgi:hypothetical protein
MSGDGAGSRGTGAPIGRNRAVNSPGANGGASRAGGGDAITGAVGRCTGAALGAGGGGVGAGAAATGSGGGGGGGAATGVAGAGPGALSVFSGNP